MKKFFTVFAAAALILAGCAKQYDDSELRNRVTTLETKVGNLEANMKAIQDATADGMFVQKVEELVEDGKVVGVTVTYTTGKVVTFQISGAGAETNLSVIKNAAGELCWALNGEILKDPDGKDLTVGQTPSFSIENGVLYMTVNGKKTEIGPMGGGLGDAIFKDIAVTDKAVVLTLDDGSKIEIPFAKAFKLVIAKTQYAVTSTDPIEIPYTVENKTANTVVDVFTDANFSAAVDEAKIVITPKAVAEGMALAYADSQVGLTSIVKLTFGAEAEPDTFEITDESLDYIAEAKDASVEVHAVSNLPFEVKPQVDWIHYVETRATNYTIILSVDDNPANEIRTGSVQIVRAGTEQVLQTINIAQKAAEKEVEPYNPAGWDKVFNMSDYKINSTFMLGGAIALNPASVTLQWKFYSNKWNDHKFNDHDAAGNQLYCNRLGEFANSDESQSVLFRFSNDGDADGQLCLNAGIFGVNQVQVSKDNKPYAWPTGEWVVLTVVCDGTNVLIYHDDVLVQTVAARPGASWSLSRFDLSMTWDDGSSWPLKQAFNGYVAFARVWNRALSVEDIAATLCEVPAAKAEGLEANWVFNGAEDKYVADAAGHENRGLDFTECWDGNGNRKDNGDAAAAAWTALAGSDLPAICYREKGSEPEPPTPPTGNIKAIYWGNAQAAAWYKEFNRAISLPDGYSMTIHFYYDAAKQQRLGNFGDKSEAPCNMLRFGEAGNNNQLEWMVDTGAGRVKIRATKDAEPGKWNAVTLTAGAAGYKMYINGELAGEDASAYRSNTSFQAIEFANSWGTAYRSAFDGAMAYISLWSKQLSAEEVAANVFKEPSGAGLEGFWPMTEGEGFLLKDKTGKYDDIDLHYCTRCDDEVNYVDVDVTPFLEWREYPAF